jgi:Trk-type K+ transport system membrane component
MTQPIARLRWFLLGYAALIAIGTTLLSLPSSAAADPLTLRQALFTAVSAVCLVGLTVVDTATDLSTSGQVVVLLLIQAGVVYYLFFAVPVVRQMNQRAEPSADEVGSTRAVFYQVLKIAALIEGGAFLLIYYTGGGQITEEVGRKAFVAAFHAVSAFGNAGFSVLPDNLLAVPRAFVLHLATLVTFGLGGLGIDVLYDLFSPRRLRQRLANPATDWRWATKVSVNTSMVLVGGGALLFYALEQHNVLAGLNLTEKLISSAFQSAAARTAGFRTVDITQLTTPTLVLMIGLMFVGGGAGSTAGGIHTATLHRAFAPRKPGQNRLRPMAWWIIGYALAVNALGVFTLHLIEPQANPVSLLFVQVSAFSSVGLSPMAVTTLSSAGQTVILLSMLLGRVGILALMMHLSTNVPNPSQASRP